MRREEGRFFKGKASLETIYFWLVIMKYNNAYMQTLVNEILYLSFTTFYTISKNIRELMCVENLCVMLPYNIKTRRAIHGST
jgi:hypothetical protein